MRLLRWSPRREAGPAGGREGGRDAGRAGGHPGGRDDAGGREHGRGGNEAVARAAHLVESLPRPEVPAALWGRIEARLEALSRGEQCGRARFEAAGGAPRALALGGPEGGGPAPTWALRGLPGALRPLARAAVPAAAAALAVAVLGLLLWLRPGDGAPAGPRIDLSEYLERVEKSAPADALLAVAEAPAQFQPGDPREALAAAGLGPAESIAETAGYALLERRVREVEEGRVAQLVYGNAAERLSLFVVPARLRFSLGGRGLVEHTLGGVRCHKLDCPRTTALLVETDRRRCLLVGKGVDESRLASLVRLLVAGESEGP